MNIVLGSKFPNDATLSITLVQETLREEFLLLGQAASCLYADDIGLRIPKVSEIEFSIRCAFLESLQSADILDFKVGDGLFSTLRGQVLKRPKPQLFVSRSHGLDHINYAVKREFSRVNKSRMSWRERSYFGGYLLWQVVNHMRLADICLFLNSEERDFAVNHLKIDGRKSIIVDNGIPDYMIGLPRRAPRAGRGGALRIAVVGTYVVRKINIAPQAIEKLLTRYEQLTFAFLGTGVDDERVLRDFEISHHDRIKNVKQFDHKLLPGMLSTYDVLFFPSMADGFGLVVFEAMACGVGVVASNLPSLTSRLRNESEALFFQSLDPAAMVDAIERIIHQDHLLEKLQYNGYNRAQDFSWRRIAAQTLDIYSEGLARKSASLPA